MDIAFSSLLLALSFMVPTPVSYTQIAHAIAVAETGGGTVGLGITQNNPCGLKKGGQDASYATREEGLAACAWIWEHHYGGLPDLPKAIRWTGNHSPEQWLWHVNRVLARD